MVSTVGYKDTGDTLKTLAHGGVVATESVVARGLGTAVKDSAETASASSLGALGGFAGATAAGAAISAGFTVWDYAQERDRIRKQYELELSARTGKPYNEVTNKDLDAAGRNNAVIADALRRVRLKRNIKLAIGTLAVAAAIATGGALMTFIATSALGLSSAAAVPGVIGAIGTALSGEGVAALTTSLAAGVPSAIAGVSAFMATEKAAERIIEPRFGLHEPSIRKVTKDPSLQDKLSLSSQVSLIQHLQKRVNPKKPNTFISQEQVFKVFLKANPEAADRIRAENGNDFSKLSAEQRILVLQKAGKEVNIEQITADINNGAIRAQELAFIVQGESSGVPRKEAPRVSALEKDHGYIQQKLEQAQAQIRHLTQKVNVQSAQLGSMLRSNTAVNMDKAEAPAEPQKPGMHARRELERRQQQGAAVLGA